MDTLLVHVLALHLEVASLNLETVTPTAEAAIVMPLPETFKADVALPRTDDLQAFAASIAQAHGLNVNHFLATISCESHWNSNIRSQYISKSGKQENSWGLVQINLDDPPTGPGSVTWKQATDPYFSIDYMAKMWDKGLERKWSCWRNLYE